MYGFFLLFVDFYDFVVVLLGVNKFLVFSKMKSEILIRLVPDLYHIPLKLIDRLFFEESLF